MPIAIKAHLKQPPRKPFIRGFVQMADETGALELCLPEAIPRGPVQRIWSGVVVEMFNGEDVLIAMTTPMQSGSVSWVVTLMRVDSPILTASGEVSRKSWEKVVGPTWATEQAIGWINRTLTEWTRDWLPQYLPPVIEG